MELYTIRSNTEPILPKDFRMMQRSEQAEIPLIVISSVDISINRILA
jgi:hypothetical protein